MKTNSAQLELKLGMSLAITLVCFSKVCPEAGSLKIIVNSKLCNFVTCWCIIWEGVLFIHLLNYISMTTSISMFLSGKVIMLIERIAFFDFDFNTD